MWPATQATARAASQPTVRGRPSARNHSALPANERNDQQVLGLEHVHGEEKQQAAETRAGQVGEVPPTL